MKKLTFILYIISIIILGILGAWIGTYMYKINSLGGLESPILEGMESKNLEEELALMANESEVIISPNANLILKTNYKKCGHEIQETMPIDSQYINMNKEEFEKEFLKDNENFTIQNFAPKEIIILKEINTNCNEHYLLKEKGGVVVIYKYDSNGNKETYKTTNIGVEYLTDADKKELEKGIEVTGENELNSRLEDYV